MRAAEGSRIAPRCVHRFLANVRVDRRLQRFGGRGFYGYEAVFAGLPAAGAGHVVLGAQREPVAVHGPDPHLTPRLGFRGVRVIGRTMVDGAPAVVGTVAARGINEGHVVVAWNAGGAGLFASVHLERLPLARRIATARALAASVRRP